MSVGQVLYILWRRAWIVALTFMFALIVAGGILIFVPGRYDAVATGSLDPGDLNPISDNGQSVSLIGLIEGNLLELVQSQRVAVDVVKRLNLTANPAVQADYRNSNSFGKESIEDWMAATIVKNVVPTFSVGTNVLEIRYKGADPTQSALLANAFLAATIDESIAMKAATGDQTARWFSPQLDDLRKDLQSARNALEQFQARTNVVAVSNGGGVDTESSTLSAISADLSNNRALLTSLQSRLSSGSTELTNDPSDPDLQMIASLKTKISGSEADLDAARNSLGSNNPKLVAATTNLATVRKQLQEIMDKSRDHLKEKIATTQSQIASLEVAQAQAQKALIAAQAQRDHLGDLQRDVAFKSDELNARERIASQARLQSKLTFAAISVLDKATAPISPAFPKPGIVMPLAVAAGFGLGMILALLAEATDRRVRCPADLRFATPGPVLGVIQHSKNSKGGRRGGLLLPAN